MSKNKKNTNELIKIFIRIVFLLLILCACFGAVGVCISWKLRNCGQSFSENVITIYASLASSFLALFGVILSILFAKVTDEEKRKYSHEPEFYISHKYDLAKAINYRLFSDGNFKSIIPNNRIFFQNSDKTDFIIEEVSIIDNDNTTSIRDVTNRFVGKGVLFFLSFYCEKSISKISIKTKSVDGHEYLFEVNTDDEIVRKK